MQTTWDLSKIYNLPASDKDFEKELKQYEEIAMEFVYKWDPKQEASTRDDYLKDPIILKEALDEYESWAKDGKGLEKISYYYHLATALDQLDPKLKARENKLHDVGVRILNEIQFFAQRIAKVDKVTQDRFLASNLLSDYHHYLERIFAEAKYLLSESEEKIMTLKSKVSYGNWVRLVSELLSKAEREILNENGDLEKKNIADIMSLIDSTDKKIRDKAAEALNDILESVLDVAAAEMNSVIEGRKVDDELRKMNRPDEGRHLEDDIQAEIVDALREVVVENNDIPAEFYKLKAQLMGQEKLAYHERNVPYGKLEQAYTYEESVDLIRIVFKKLHPKFEELLEAFLDGRIDVYSKKGKDDGAFYSPGPQTSKGHIMLNHNNRLRDVLTLAHELGHGIHFEMMRDKQNSLNFGASMATAEVASTFMEDFVLQEISADIDDSVRLALNMAKLKDDVSTISRQIACYNLEMEFHTEFRKQGYLSKEILGEIFSKHMKTYMGEYVEQSTGSQNWWVYWSHLRYFFYVYSYASGLLISKSLQHSVKEDPIFVEKVIKFFEAGESKSPRDIFLELGIDIKDKDFWKKGMDEVRALLEETKELAKKLNLI